LRQLNTLKLERRKKRKKTKENCVRTREKKLIILTPLNKKELSPMDGSYSHRKDWGKRAELFFAGDRLNGTRVGPSSLLFKDLWSSDMWPGTNTVGHHNA